MDSGVPSRIALDIFKLRVSITINIWLCVTSRASYHNVPHYTVEISTPRLTDGYLCIISPVILTDSAPRQPSG